VRPLRVSASAGRPAHHQTPVERNPMFYMILGGIVVLASMVITIRAIGKVQEAIRDDEKRNPAQGPGARGAGEEPRRKS
jgi:ABC-type branched-subunit amino acid transport system permease subunit